MLARDSFSIGVLSTRSKVNIETIRYYERVGLLRKPARTAGGYRTYRPTDIDRLRFIRRARDLGFALDDIRRLLDLADQKSRSCRRVTEIAVAHLVDVRAKLSDLERMEGVLSGLVDSCSAGTMPDCPLLETLAQAV